MAVKTITIDMEAYEIFAAAQRSNESFRTVIKNVLGPASHTASALLHHLDSARVSTDYLAAMEEVVQAQEGDLIAAEYSSSPYGETDGS